MDKPITVLLVDDHEVVRRGLRASLEARPDFKIVGEAESGTKAVQLAGECVPDVILMDLIMPGMDGVEATRQVKNTIPRTQGYQGAPRQGPAGTQFFYGAHRSGDGGSEVDRQRSRGT